MKFFKNLFKKKDVIETPSFTKALESKLTEIEKQIGEIEKSLNRLQQTIKESANPELYHPTADHLKKILDTLYAVYNKGQDIYIQSVKVQDMQKLAVAKSEFEHLWFLHLPKFKKNEKN